MSQVYTDRARWLLSANTSGAGTALDSRMVLPYGYILYVCPSASAIIKMQASIDSTAWMDVATYTATPTTATAQHSGFFPYLRGVTHLSYSAASPTGTGLGFLYFAGGIG